MTGHLKNNETFSNMLKKKFLIHFFFLYEMRTFGRETS